MISSTGVLLISAVGTPAVKETRLLILHFIYIDESVFNDIQLFFTTFIPNRSSAGESTLTSAIEKLCYKRTEFWFIILNMLTDSKQYKIL